MVHNIHPVTLYQWKRNMGEKPEEKINAHELLQEIERLKKQNKQLTSALGELTLDNQCLKDLNEFLKKKQMEELLKPQKNSSSKTKGPIRK